ncbi:flagellar hook-length control protein FliK [Sphingomonas hankookensis]|uniref:flagellar hook-length control protein FliK n=1 Tax=Sphingomonas hankookensis TaxID=563996 RepID=UPI001F5690FB|nr:flagellar hook-length control protein FliK [Sphingomonas hankookensis]
MQLLSALTSTTSPLAMQAMPVVAPQTADFAALLAGMAPGEAMAAAAAPDVRQFAALPGKGLPPVALGEVADATPVLPVTATEAVSMLPAALADPKVAVPVIAAAVGAPAKLLPEQDAPPPEPEKPAVIVLSTPPRFALPLPRGRKLEAEVPREQPPEPADEGDAETVASDPVPVPVPVPEVVVAADPVVRADIVLPAPPRVAHAADASPPAQTILEDGSVVAADPTTPMRPAKRTGKAPIASPAMPVASAVPQAVDARAVGRSAPPAVAGSPASGTAPLPGEPVPASTATAALAPMATPTSTEQVPPAIGRTTPLQADGVVPVHIVVPPQGDAAIAADPLSPLATPARTAPFDAEAIVRPAAPRVQAAANGLRAGAESGLAPRDARSPVQRQAPIWDIAEPVRPVRDAVAPTPQAASAFEIAESGPPARDTAVPVPQQASISDMPAPVITIADPIAAQPAIIGAARSARPTPASVRQQPAITERLAAAPALPLAEAPAIQALAGAAVRTLPSDNAVGRSVLGGTLRQPEADAMPSEAQPAIAADAGTPVPSLVTAQPIAIPTPAATAPASANDPIASTVTRFDPIAIAARRAPTAIPRQPGVDVPHSDAAPAAVAPISVSVANTAPVAAEAPTQPVPQAIASPLPGVTTQPLADAAQVRQPIAGEAAAPVVSVAPHADPVAKAAPVTRIAMPTPSAESVAAPAIVDAAAPASRARRDEDAPALPTATAGTLDPVVLRPVAAPVQAGQPTLDTRQPQWMEGMIDRIETLRESAGTNGETRIRLSPDALGDVEIAIRTSDDGKVHIHFNSENADAGRLLADAQPRLVQLAEARGLKLGGMQVDVGTQQQPSQRQAQEQGNAPPRAPRSATTTAAPPSTNDNQRIA